MKGSDPAYVNHYSDIRLITSGFPRHHVQMTLDVTLDVSLSSVIRFLPVATIKGCKLHGRKSKISAITPKPEVISRMSL